MHAQRQGGHQGCAVAAGDVHRSGLKYVGPIDGHDEHAVEVALRNARGFNAPVIVHVATRKGMGYGPAETDEADQMHSTGVIDPHTGLSTSVAAPGWTSVFSEELIERAANRRDIVAITAAMPGPTGLLRSGSATRTGSSTSASPSSTR